MPLLFCQARDGVGAALLCREKGSPGLQPRFLRVLCPACRAVSHTLSNAAYCVLWEQKRTSLHLGKWNTAWHVMHFKKGHMKCEDLVHKMVLNTALLSFF